MKVSVHEAEMMMRDNLSEMRKEYTRMRDIAQKRIKRLSESEFTDTDAYKSHKTGFKKIKEIDPRDFAKAYSELSKFMEAKGSSISGQRDIRRKTIKRFNDQGINVNNSNYNVFIRVLNEMRSQKLIYGSDTAEDATNLILELQNRGFDVDDIIERLSVLLPNRHRFSELLDETSGMEIVSRKMDFDELLDKVGW